MHTPLVCARVLADVWTRARARVHSLRSPSVPSDTLLPAAVAVNPIADRARDPVRAQARQLSFSTASFQTLIVDPSDDDDETYNRAADFWQDLHTSWVHALEALDPDRGGASRARGGSLAHYWAAHQRFFRHLVKCRKVRARTRARDCGSLVCGSRSLARARAHTRLDSLALARPPLPLALSLSPPSL